MLVKKVARFIERHRLLEVGDRVLVAVSGGPDSLCLLHVLRRLAPRYRLSLVVAHLDHGIRPEARREAEAVRRLAEAWGLPFEGAAADVPAYRAGRRLSASEASRVVRYRFLLEAAQKHGAGKIALGQQLDDQAETVLLNLLRGTGPDGLAGILPRRRFGSVELIRPLLEISRREIEQYCRQEGLEPLLDASNLKTDYTRNRIRLELIPYLEQQFNPNLKRSLAHLAALAAADRAYLEAEAQEKFQQVVRREKGRLIINREALNALPAALRGRVAHRALLELLPGRELNRRHVEQLLQLAERPGPERELTLPGGVRAYCSYRSLVITAEDPVRKKDSLVLPLQLPGCTPLPGGAGAIKAYFAAPADLSWPPQPHQAYLDFDLLPPGLMLRTRWPGARFHPQGAPGSKKLKDFLIDQKVPHHRRDDCLLVAAGDEVIWVVGHRIAHPYRVTEKTRQVLVLELKKNTQEERAVE
ncbi:MAG: tRNA lysidine(34) synthetase TilS [Firmicutes bacterium]|jgi:tRNA(Ile)-lysidine synthase|nr:tRNA lysidine(34) synthetase TilS [Bacillota bacterium]HPU00733.1 tRNA lysidine(34) synthetase TilS [Bacillota bacterium]